MEGTTSVVHEIVLTHEITRHEVATRHAGNETMNASPDPKLIGLHASACSGRERQCKADEASGRGRPAIAYPQHLPLGAMGTTLEIGNIDKTPGRVLQTVGLQ